MKGTPRASCGMPLILALLFVPAISNTAVVSQDIMHDMHHLACDHMSGRPAASYRTTLCYLCQQLVLLRVISHEIICTIMYVILFTMTKHEF